MTAVCIYSIVVRVSRVSSEDELALICAIHPTPTSVWAPLRKNLVDVVAERAHPLLLLLVDLLEMILNAFFLQSFGDIDDVGHSPSRLQKRDDLLFGCLMFSQSLLAGFTVTDLLDLLASLAP